MRGSRNLRPVPSTSLAYACDDNDKDLCGNLVAEAGKDDSPFSIVDRSLYEPFDEKWREEVRALIRKSDLVIVICGEHTDQASGVAGEVTITQEEKRPYFLLKGRRKKRCSRPTTAPQEKIMHPWAWPTLKRLIANPRQA